MHNQRFMGEVGGLWVSWILLAIVSTSKAQTGGNSSQISEIPVERLIDLLTFIFHRYEDLMWDVIGVFLVFMLMILALLYNIYHRRQAEEELRQQHRHLENLVEERTRTLQQLNENLEQELRERQQIEASLREAKAAAEAATKAKSSFLATMSHEIRTPMNGVIGMTSLLRGTPLTAEQQEYVEAIRVSGETLLAIINDILDFSKIESGKMELEHVPFDLHQCIEETFDLLSTKALEKRLDLLYLIDSDVPTGITGDITRLRQVLVNLVGNAIKFTEKGEVFVSVTVASRTETGVVLQFAVRDTGIGIPEDRLDRLFQSFSQVDSSITRKFGGTGLGLAICSRLVQLMGGTIWVESRLGSGSTFYFTLPTQSAEVKASRFPVDDAPELAGKRILIVDDNPTNCRILTRQFERWKMRPHAVASGEKAIQALQDAVFDLAILDLHMPGMDGLELAHHIRETFPRHRLPLILLSSTTLTSGMRELFQAAITKPVKLSHLFDTIIAVFADTRIFRPQPQKVVETRFDKTLAKRLPMHILLAEDNAVNQRLVQRMLEKMGYRADVAGNGIEVLEALQRQPYDLIFMDMQMPEMDGLETTKRILEQYPPENRPHIIAMTANAMQGDRERCLAAGMDDYLSKPIQLMELVQVLERWGHHVTESHTHATAKPHPPRDLLDYHILDDILSMGNGSPDFLIELLQMYLPEAEEYLVKTEKSLAEGDLKTARRMLHSLKGSSSNLGVKCLAILCEQTEHMDGITEIKALLPRLQECYQQTQHAITDFMAHLEARCEPR